MLMTVEETFKSLRVSRATLDRLVGAGQIDTVRIGRRKLFKPEVVQRFIEDSVSSSEHTKDG